MGVNLEKYVGVVVDIDIALITSKIYAGFMDNFYHGFDDKLYKPLKEDLDALNFKRDSDLTSWENGIKEGDILIVEDDMTGDYLYLMYVITHDYVESGDELSNCDKKVNELLTKLEPPVEIVEKLNKVHELLFEVSLSESRYIYLNHYS